MYSLIEGAKLSGINPQHYLADLLARIADPPARPTPAPAPDRPGPKTSPGRPSSWPDILPQGRARAADLSAKRASTSWRSSWCGTL